MVCRVMGFTGGEALHEAHFGPGTGPIFLDAVTCTGQESALGQCMRGDWEANDCSHWEDASVRCGTFRE